MIGSAMSPESITTTGSMDSGPAPSGASPMCNCTSGMTGQSPVSGKKFQRLLARREAAEFTIVGIVLRRLRRPEHDEFLAVLCNQRGQRLAVVGRHVPRPAMRAVVVAHARPLIGP